MLDNHRHLFLISLLVLVSPLTVFARSSNSCSGLDSDNDRFRSCPPPGISLKYARLNSGLVALHYPKTSATTGANYRFGGSVWKDSGDTRQIDVSDKVSLTVDLSPPAIHNHSWLVEKLLLEIEGRRIVLEAFHLTSQVEVSRSQRLDQAIRVALAVSVDPY